LTYFTLVDNLWLIKRNYHRTGGVMPFVSSTSAPVFSMHGAIFTGLASPSRGAVANAVWMVEISANSPGTPHRLTHEETLVPTEGTVTASVDDEVFELVVGSALVVPAGAELHLSNPHPTPFKAVVVFPVGGKAILAGEEPFTPPWAI
jgi:quercetin dioxygenase-like cupin family protein